MPGAWSITQTMLPEFDHEMATTRTLLAAVPDAFARWQPHAKSMTLGRLAAHIANMPNWLLLALQQDELDVGVPGATGQTSFESTAATLARFDALVKTSRNVLADTPDAVLQTLWTLKHSGHAIFSMPRGAVLRAWAMNHMIHHRGQLSVYLRLLDVPVPSVYGPTADSGS
jgi:uncharacterized damage-inducible protein DinB